MLHWTKIELDNGDGRLAYTGNDNLDEEFRRALAECLTNGSIDGYFIVDENGNADYNTGPKPSEIDWTGFEA